MAEGAEEEGGERRRERKKDGGRDEKGDLVPLGELKSLISEVGKHVFL